MAEMKIKGSTYKVEPLVATEAIRLQVRVLKVLGGALDRLPEILDSRGKDETAFQKAAIAAFSDIFMKSNPDEITDLLKNIVEVAMILRPSKTYEQVDLDQDFTGKLDEAFELAVFVLREQFSAFFTDSLVSGGLSRLAKN